MLRISVPHTEEALSLETIGQPSGKIPVALSTRFLEHFSSMASMRAPAVPEYTVFYMQTGNLKVTLPAPHNLSRVDKMQRSMS